MATSLTHQTQWLTLVIVLSLYCTSGAILSWRELLNQNKMADLGPEPRLLNPDWTPYVVDPDITKVLSCYVDSPSPFTVSWYKEGKPLAPSKNNHYTFEDNNQKLKWITACEDSGTYRCVAKNQAGYVQFEAKIEIFDSPYIFGPKIVHIDSSPVEVTLGGDTNLTCRIFQGSASIGLKVEWLLDGEKVNDSWSHEYNQEVMESGVMNAVLILRNITNNDLGVYTCVATNQVSTEKNVTVIKKTDPPDDSSIPYIYISFGCSGVLVFILVALVLAFYKRWQHQKSHTSYIDQLLDPSKYDLPEVRNKYDIFVSYSNKEEQWVRQILMPHLENQGYRICIDFKQYILGTSIVANIMEGIYHSRLTLVVLSQHFLSCNYKMFELQAAHYKIFMMNQRQMVIINYDDCKIPGELIGMTYLDWTEESQESRQPQFWNRLYTALGDPDPEPHSDSTYSDSEDDLLLDIDFDESENTDCNNIHNLNEHKEEFMDSNRNSLIRVEV